MRRGGCHRQDPAGRGRACVPGHIACDSASNSELVIPLVKEGRLIGVLDLDSPKLARFSEADQVGLERLAAIFLELTDC
ncbi:GAF domain-containing protein [Pseudomonas juntendi]|nr:GAF domain-containing protein [Pseudomonas juntendi]